MNLTLRQLRAFVALAQARSFTAAARRLATTQSGLSAAIASLEAAVGLRLFERSTRRVALSVAGEEFFPAAQRILGDLDASVQDLAALATLRRGTLSIGCPPAIGSALLLEPIAQFRRQYPRVRVVMHDSASGLLASRLRSGEVDLVVGAMPRPEPELESWPLLEDRLILIAPRGDPLARHRSRPWRVLLEQPVIAPSRDSSTRALIEATFESATGERFQPALEAAYWLTIVSMVEAGLGVAVVPEYAVSQLPIRRVQRIGLTQPSVTRRIDLLTHRSRERSPAARAFIDILLGTSRIGNPGRRARSRGVRAAAGEGGRTSGREPAS